VIVEWGARPRRLPQAYPEVMGLTIQIEAAIHARLVEEARALGLEVADYAAQLLSSAAGPSIPATVTGPREIGAWLNQMAQFSDRIPAMPGETFAREMIYQDHD
jgi:hypothetical protein